MIRTNLANVDIQRTLRPLYGWTQATPKSAFIAQTDGDYNFSVPVFPGMVFTHVGGEQYDLVSAALDTAANDLGLIGQFIGGAGIDEVADEGIGAIGVWSLGPDAEFEVLAPAFVDAVTAGTKGVLLYGATAADADQGKLCLVGQGSAGTARTTKPVAVLLEVISDTKIRIGGLKGQVS